MSLQRVTVLSTLSDYDYMGLLDGLKGFVGGENESKKSLDDQIRDFKQSYNLSPEPVESDSESQAGPNQEKGNGKSVDSFMNDSKKTLRRLGGRSNDITQIHKDKIQDRVEDMRSQLSSLKDSEKSN